MQLFYDPQFDPAAGTLRLDEEEARHALRVMRLDTGDSICVTDGRGNLYTCRIIEADRRRSLLTVQPESVDHGAGVLPYRLTMAVAPTKNMDRIEWLVEKAVEMGIDRLTPLRCRCSERKELKTERLGRIAVAAMKQSLKATLPQIDAMTDIRDYLAEPAPDGTQRFIAHCVAEENRFFVSHAVKPSATVRVLIGPEGDFSDDEIRLALRAGFVPVSLGSARLRTETASLAAVHTVHLVNELAARGD